MLIWHLQLESAARPVCLPDGNSMSYLKHMVSKDVHTLMLTCPEFDEGICNNSCWSQSVMDGSGVAWRWRNVRMNCLGSRNKLRT